jgi:hypothetical protein
VAKGETERYIDRIDEFATRIVDRVNYGRLRVWKDLLFKPQETLKKEAKKASLLRGALDIIVSGFVQFAFFSIFYGLLILVFLILVALLSLAITKSVRLEAMVPLIGTIVMIVIGLIAILLVFSVVGWLVYSTLEFIIAKLLGGVGGYREHLYLTALQGAALSIASFPFTVVQLIPCISLITYPIAIGLAIYSIYIRYLIVRQIHELPRNESILVILLPIILIMCAVIAFYILMILLALLGVRI